MALKPAENWRTFVYEGKTIHNTQLELVISYTAEKKDDPRGEYYEITYAVSVIGRDSLAKSGHFKILSTDARESYVIDGIVSKAWKSWVVRPLDTLKELRFLNHHDDLGTNDEIEADWDTFYRRDGTSYRCDGTVNSAKNKGVI